MKSGNPIISARVSEIGEQQIDNYYKFHYSILLGYSIVKSVTKLKVFPLKFIVNFMWSKAQYQHGRLAHLLGGSSTSAINSEVLLWRHKFQSYNLKYCVLVKSNSKDR
jgi:hypothetical protein